MPFSLTLSNFETQLLDWGAELNSEDVIQLVVQAPSNQLIVDFRLCHNDSNIWYSYTTGELSSSDPNRTFFVGTSSEGTTCWQDGTQEGSTLAFLNLQKVRLLLANTVLTGFQLEKNGDLIRYRYWYAYLLVNGGEKIVELGDPQTTFTMPVDCAPMQHPPDEIIISSEGNRALTGFQLVHKGSQMIYKLTYSDLLGVEKPRSNPVLRRRTSEQWMATYEKLIQNLTLGEICIPGSRAAGMGPNASKFPNRAGRMESSTGAYQTQSYSVQGQLERGVRWLDLSPMRLPSGEYVTYYGSPVWGGKGDSFESIISGINSFTAKYPTEMIVLSLSAGLQYLEGGIFKEFTLADWISFISNGLLNGSGTKIINAITLSRLTEIDQSNAMLGHATTYSIPDNTCFSDIPIKHLFGRVIVTIQDDSFVFTDKVERYFYYSRGIFDRAAFPCLDTSIEEGGSMKASLYFSTQIDKLNEIPARNAHVVPVLLNWTLSQSAASAMTGQTSMLTLSTRAHAALANDFVTAFQTKGFKKYPNIILIDHYDTSVLEVIFWILEHAWNRKHENDHEAMCQHNC